MIIELPKHKKIGISLSGGADSALLSFLVMKTYQEDLHFFTFASQEKSFRTVKNSISVLNRCLEITGKINCHHHIKYGYQQQRDIFLDFLLDNVNSGLVDIILTATTSAPPLEIQQNFTEQLPYDIKARRNNKKIKSNYSHENKLFHPWINYTKKDIFNRYRELNILDSLYPLTSSCESMFQTSGHCGHCWWCQERLWAFGSIQ